MKVHLREKRIRGLNVEGNPKYCFVEWLEVEQNEPGDTLTHTFNFPSWGPGECRWWHFRAEIAGSPSVSNTGIITACYEEQENAMSLKHTDLVDKEPGGVIDHADATITPDKMVAPFVWNDTPFTPSAAPTEDYEVANKKYVDDNAGGVSSYGSHRPGNWYGCLRQTGSSSGTRTPGVAQMFPFFTAEDLTIDTARINSVIASGSGGRIWIYSDNGNGYPGALYHAPVSLGSNPAGIRTTALAMTFVAGLYWICYVTNGNPSLTRLISYWDNPGGYIDGDFLGRDGPFLVGVTITNPPDPFTDPPGGWGQSPFAVQFKAT